MASIYGVYFAGAILLNRWFVNTEHLDEYLSHRSLKLTSKTQLLAWKLSFPNGNVILGKYYQVLVLLWKVVFHDWSLKLGYYRQTLSGIPRRANPRLSYLSSSSGQHYNVPIVLQLPTLTRHTRDPQQ